jgi:hypothetical protein
MAMAEWKGLVAAEVLKLTRRRLSWVVFGLLALALVQHARNLRTDLLDYRQAQTSGLGRFGQPVSPELALVTEESLIRRMSFPGFLDELWVVTDVWGVFAFLILGALQAGEEFDAGTARTLLHRGVRRGEWPLAKLAALLLAAAAVWAALALLDLPVGMWAQRQATGEMRLSALTGPVLAGHALRLLRSWMGLGPYLACALGFAVLARGAGPALAVGLGGRFVELVSSVVGALLIGLRLEGSEALSGLYRVWSALHVASFEWNVRVWTTWGDPVWARALSPYPASGQRLVLPAPLHHNPWLAGLLLLGWTIFWMGLASWSLRRRDVSG